MKIVIAFLGVASFFLFFSWAYANNVYQYDTFCKKTSGIYTVNDYVGNSFSPQNPIGEIYQIVKKGSYLFFAELTNNTYATNGVDDYDFSVTLFEYNCKTKILSTNIFARYTLPYNGTLSSPEIDMIDNRYIIVRAYNSLINSYEHLYYDRKSRTDFHMVDAMNSTSNFHSILDYRSTRTGKGKVLIRLANMSSIWMNYDLDSRRFF